MPVYIDLSIDADADTDSDDTLKVVLGFSSYHDLDPLHRLVN